MSAPRPMRIALIAVIPTPYRDASLRALERREEVDLDVFYCARTKPDRPWNVDWALPARAIFPRSINLFRALGPSASCYWNPALVPALKKGAYDLLIVCGYNHLSMLCGMRWARSAGVPYILFCESHLQRPRAVLKRWVKEIAVRKVVSRASGGLPTGVLAAQYLKHYGCAEDRIARWPNAPDLAALRERITARLPEREDLRAALGLRPGGRAVLFAGRLLPTKRPGLAVESFARRKRKADDQLIIAGDGPERERLIAQSQSLGISDHVIFTGFVEPARLEALYLAADLLFLPSRETWGVVPLEALASGLPLLLSEDVGCAPDALRRPELGRVVAGTSADDFAEALDSMLSATPDRNLIWGASESTMQRFAYPQVAHEIVQLIQQCVSST